MQEQKKKEKRKKATKLRSFCDSKLLHLRKSRFRGREGKTLRAVYFIKYSETLLYVCIALLYLYFSIYVFSTPSSDKGCFY